MLTYQILLISQTVKSPNFRLFHHWQLNMRRIFRPKIHRLLLLYKIPIPRLKNIRHILLRTPINHRNHADCTCTPILFPLLNT
jgi:hypothetical protein